MLVFYTVDCRSFSQTYEDLVVLARRNVGLGEDSKTMQVQSVIS